jgi:hypothetical protein
MASQEESMAKNEQGTTGGTRRAKKLRGDVKHFQQTRVADAEGREEPMTRGKQQKVEEKKEARPTVTKRKMQKKPAKPRASTPGAAAKRRGSSKKPGSAKARGSK